MRPSVEITKVDGGTGVVRPSAIGVLAIIACCALGTKNQAASHARTQLAVTQFGNGPLTEYASYVMPVSGKPTVLIRAEDTTPGAYSAITTSAGGGTCVATADATEPLDQFDVTVEWLVGGTIGIAGIVYRYTLDGKNWSKKLALGTANTLTIPNTNVGLDLGAGTIVAGRTDKFTTSRPMPTNADLPDALEALRVTSSPWDAVLIDGEADNDTVTLVDNWLKDQNKRGKYKTALLMAPPMAADETEDEYKDRLSALFDVVSGTDIVVVADRGDLVSAIRGITQPRPFAVAVAARGMKNNIGRDVAYVADGPVPGFGIKDERKNPKYHDEALFPGIDDLRIATATTLEGLEGTYITNAPLLSPSGSDYVYWQHARVMNRGCEIAFQILQRELSAGVDKDPKPGPQGERYIAEKDAQRIEELVNAQLDRQIVSAGQASDMKLKLSRVDDISSNEGAEVNAELESVSLAYIKKFKVAAGYVKAIGG